MGETVVWDVYRMVQGKKPESVPIHIIAEGLNIDIRIAEECAIVLDLLEFIQFDAEHKEIMPIDRKAVSLQVF